MIKTIPLRRIAVGLGVLPAVVAGIGVGYFTWGYQKDFFVSRDLSKLPPGPQSELIRYGLELVVNTAQHIGPLAEDPAMRYGGNSLACTNCHLNAGLKEFAAPFVSTFATFPMMVSDTVESLADRLNSCMTHSLNGKPMPEAGREMQALIAYIQYLSVGTREGVRLPGMGLLSLKPASETPDASRGATVYAANCAKCHGASGEGEPELSPKTGWAIPPLWGDDSFNSTAGMANIEMAAAFIRANMPFGIEWNQPILTVQEAWDVAAYVTTRPRPIGPSATAAPATSTSASTGPDGRSP